MFILDTTSAILSVMFFSGLVSTLFSAVFIITVILCIAAEEFGKGYLALFLYVILLSIFTPVNVFVVMWHHPSQVFGFFLLYFIIGALYSALKYGSFVRKLIHKVKEAKKQFIDENKLSIAIIDEIPQDYQSKWDDFKRSHLSTNDMYKIRVGLRPGNQKTLIINWIAFWPFSAIGLFVADPLKRLVINIYDHMISVYSKMYDSIVGSNINKNDL